MRLLRSRQQGRRTAGERGQALVEFAIVAVVFFMLIMGVFDTARMFQSWVAVQHASREGARYAITGQTAKAVACTGGNTRPTCIVQTAKDGMTGVIDGCTVSTSCTVSCQAWDYPAYTTVVAGPTTDCTGNSAGLQCDALEVTVAYKHEFVTPIMKALLPAGVTIHGKQRMINEPFGLCS